MIFMCIGACMGPVVGKTLVIVESSGSGGIDWNQCVWAGIGGSVGATLGWMLGMIMFPAKD